MALTDKLTAIADAIRAKTGGTAALTLDQMPTEITSIQMGSNITDGTEVTFGNVKMLVSGIPDGKASYNGVILPILPTDVIDSYPYAFIKKSTDGVYYYLIMGKRAFWHVGSIIHPQTGIKKMYRVTISYADRATKWTFEEDVNNYFGDSNIFWSSHDIHSGSADSSEIYFVGSKPAIGGETTLVPAEREEVYSITSEDLNKLGAAVQSFTGATETMTVEEMMIAFNSIPIAEEASF